jgi:hypothetical protein
MQKINKDTFPSTQLEFLGYNVEDAVSYTLGKDPDGSIVLGLYDKQGQLLKPRPLLSPIKPDGLVDILAANYHTLAGAYRDLYAAYNKLKAQAYGFVSPTIQHFIISELNKQQQIVGGSESPTEG